MTEKPEIAVIGLGAMGLGMAKNLLKAGFAVRGCDMRADALERLREAGGTPCRSARSAADGVDQAMIMVVNAEQVDTVLFDEATGIVDVMPQGAVIIVNATISPAAARDFGGRLSARGLLMLDAPVSGGMVGAENGTLTIMGSGAPEAFERTKRALDAVAATVYRLGDDPGAGSTVKMINQLLAGVHIASAAEAIAFGTRNGVDPAVLYEIICKSAGGSWMFQNRVPTMLKGIFDPPTSAVEIFVKDLGIVLDTGREARFPLPIAAAAHQLFLAAAGAGFGGIDDSAVVKVYEALTGVDVGGAAGSGRTGTPAAPPASVPASETNRN